MATFTVFFCGTGSNSFEALPFFMGAVIVAHQLGAAQARLDILAFVWIVLRLIYVVMYVADLPAMRSAVWTLALIVNIGILFVGYRQGLVTGLRLSNTPGL